MWVIKMKNRKYIYFVLATISIGFLVYNYFSTGLEYGMMSHHYGYYNNYSRNFDLLNTGLVFLAYVVLILCAILILREKTTVSNTALEILNDRLSRGEISIEEYQTLKHILMESRFKI